MTKKLVCLGMGYSAAALAQRLLPQGWTIVGTCRSDEKRVDLAARGFGTVLFSRQDALSADVLDGATHVISSISPDEHGDLAAAWLAENVTVAGRLQWAALLSTTGVYGDRGGDWVDEDAELRPTGIRSQRRVASERAWLDLYRAHGIPTHIFRLAGIYGPGRSPLDRIRHGDARRIVKPGLVLGRIHLADIVGVLSASMENPRPGAIYNVTDDEPAPPQDVVTYGCGLLGIEPPPTEDFTDAEMSAMARSFYEDCKRVRNDRMKRELGYRLCYPTYRDGLAALAASPSRENGGF